MPYDTAPRPFLAEAEAIVAQQQAIRDQHHTGGVSWSAMDCRVPEVADVEEVRRRLEENFTRQEAWKLTPAGRFVAAARELHDLGWTDEIRALREVFYACQRAQPVGHEPLVRAIRILNGIDHSTAREGVTALCDLAVPLPEAA